MQNPILVSVVLPVYNAEKFLPESLNNLLGQSLKDIEIICVNDGSQDSSLQILKDISAKDSRIVVIDSLNCGAGAARNKALDVAKGEYVSFLDADDQFDERLLEKLYKKAKATDADVVFCEWGILEQDGKKHKVTKAKGCSETENLAGRSLPFEYFGSTAWNKLFRREMIQAKGLYFQTIKTCNDIGFVWSALVAAKRIFYVPEHLIYWRRGNSNLTSQRWKSTQNFIEAGNFIKENIARLGSPSDLKQFYTSITENLGGFVHKCG